MLLVIYLLQIFPERCLENLSTVLGKLINVTEVIQSKVLK